MRIVTSRQPVSVEPAEPGLFPDASLLSRARALSRTHPELVPTPVVRARALDARADPTGGTRVWLALESMQVTGSFKVRGALLSLGQVAAEKKPLVVAASAGNHGAGVAFAARALGLAATVVVPASAPATKRDKIAAYGAEIVLA